MAGQGRRTSPETVKRIVERKKAGETNEEISKGVGIAARSVGRILTREGFPRSKFGPKPKQTETKNHG